MSHDSGTLEHSRRRISTGAGLAHDAGNLIGALGLYCDLMSRPGVISPDFQHYLTELRQLAVRGESLIERLLELDWSRFGMAPAGTGSPGSAFPPSPLRCNRQEPREEEMVNPAVALKSFQGLLARLAGPKVLLSIDCCCDEAFLPMDVESLERILVNLTTNAVHAMPTGGPLHLRWSMETGVESWYARNEDLTGHPQILLLSVEDMGRGMPPEMAESLSTGGPRAENSRSSRGDGRGLGLRIVRELVEASGGMLQIDSRPGEGTRVEMAWPLTLYTGEAKSDCMRQNASGGSFHSTADAAFSANITISSQGPVEAEQLQTGGQISAGFNQTIATGVGDSAIC
ncbi:MAG: sensor histidine kinase [Acidobacteriaceae bacterium]